MYYRKNSSDLPAWVYVLALIACLACWWGMNATEDAKADKCSRAGYAPIYVPVGRYSREVRYCQRVVDGQTEVINPEDLP